MTETTKEKLLMAKSLRDVDNAYEMIAFIYMWRKRELFQTLFILSFTLNIYFILKYTDIVNLIIKKIF